MAAMGQYPLRQQFPVSEDRAEYHSSGTLRQEGIVVVAMRRQFPVSEDQRHSSDTLLPEGTVVVAMRRQSPVSEDQAECHWAMRVLGSPKPQRGTGRGYRVVS